MTATRRPALLRYGVALVGVYLATGFLIIPKVGEHLFVFVFLGIFAGSWYGGIGPGLFATALMVGNILVMVLLGHGSVSPWQALDLSMIGLSGLLISVLVEALHAERRRAEASGEEARRGAERLRRSEEALRDADRRKNEFLAVLAHELRNPLAAIGTAVRLIGAGGDPEEAALGAEVIGRQVEHLARLVDDLMDVSRIAQGKVRLRPERLDLRSAIGQAVEVVRPAADERGHALSLALPDEPLWLSGDPTRLRQVVLNLLSNAVKYTEPGGRIHLEALRRPSEVVLTVRDNGVGIAPEMLPRVFEMFAQADRTLGHAQGGMGIGLTLVRELCSLHGGSVAAHSDGAGKGSEFTARFPAAEPPGTDGPGEPGAA